MRRTPTDPVLGTRLALLVTALVLDVAATAFLVLDGLDRLAGSAAASTDSSKLWYGVIFGWPALLALLACALPGAGPRRACTALGIVGLVLAVLGAPLYGLGLFYLLQACLALAAGLVTGDARAPRPVG